MEEFELEAILAAILASGGLAAAGTTRPDDIVGRYRDVVERLRAGGGVTTPATRLGS
jgi:hypothetical protein